MKKILALVLALCTLSAVTVFSTGAAEVDVTNTGEYYVSEKPFEDIAQVDGIKVIGHLGDLDSDEKITIMDATIIQLAIAKKTTLNDTQTLLADTDRDGGLSVMDATDVQRYIAKIGNDLKVAHTLYHRFTNSDKEVFQQIVSFLKKHAAYSSSIQRYRYEFYNTDGSGYTMITYYEADGLMKISNLESFNAGDSEGTLDFDISSNSDYCEFRASLFSFRQVDYSTDGLIEYNADSKKLNLTHNEYYTETELSKENANILIVEQIDMMVSSIEKFMGGELTGDVYTLFA